MRASDVAELRAFVAVVETGNFSRAAKTLQVSPSALSQIIRQLEERVGALLLNRTTRSVAPTEAGQRLYGRTRPALAELALAIADVNGVADKPAGRLRLSVSRLGAELFVEPILGGFHRAYPDIVLDVIIDDSKRDLIAGGFDAGIRLGEWLDRDATAIELTGPLRQVAFASPGYLRQHGTPKTPADLRQHACINWRPPGAEQVYDWEFKHGANDWFSVAVRGPLVVSERWLMLLAALDGVGIGFWVPGPVLPWVKKKRLQLLLTRWSAQFPGYYFYYPKQRQTPATVKALADYLIMQRKLKNVVRS